MTARTYECISCSGPRAKTAKSRLCRACYDQNITPQPQSLRKFCSVCQTEVSRYNTTLRCKAHPRLGAQANVTVVPKIFIMDLVALAADLAGISVREIIGLGRRGTACKVRQACFLVAREFGHTTKQIGRRMSRDHSTVIHGSFVASELVERDMVYCAFVMALRKAGTSSVPFVRDQMATAFREPVWRYEFGIQEPSEPEPSPDDDDTDDLDDIALLSQAVARHYARPIATARNT